MSRHAGPGSGALASRASHPARLAAVGGRGAGRYLALRVFGDRAWTPRSRAIGEASKGRGDPRGAPDPRTALAWRRDRPDRLVPPRQHGGARDQAARRCRLGGQARGRLQPFRRTRCRRSRCPGTLRRERCSWSRPRPSWPTSRICSWSRAAGLAWPRRSPSPSDGDLRGPRNGSSLPGAEPTSAAWPSTGQCSARRFPMTAGSSAAGHARPHDRLPRSGFCQIPAPSAQGGLPRRASESAARGRT